MGCRAPLTSARGPAAPSLNRTRAMAVAHGTDPKRAIRLPLAASGNACAGWKPPASG